MDTSPLQNPIKLWLAVICQWRLSAIDSADCYLPCSTCYEAYLAAYELRTVFDSAQDLFGLLQLASFPEVCGSRHMESLIGVTLARDCASKQLVWFGSSHHAI